MEETDKPKNSIVDIKKYLDDEEFPITGAEFKVFWESLTEEEKDYYRNTDLS